MIEFNCRRSISALTADSILDVDVAFTFSSLSIIIGAMPAAAAAAGDDEAEEAEEIKGEDEDGAGGGEDDDGEAIIAREAIVVVVRSLSLSLSLVQQLALA